MPVLVNDMGWKDLGFVGNTFVKTRSVASAIEACDANIGRLVDHLQSKDIAQNTLLILSWDRHHNTTRSPGKISRMEKAL